ncbi:hypothetical protein MASSI9I_20489 [Massilia sp. 9I]|nr:hypothetical protein MASSI9I_20489 [Massilia sp. 9I]
MRWLFCLAPLSEWIVFIKAQQQLSMEFCLAEGQSAPTLVQYFSDQADPFKSVLPKLTAG